MPREVMRDRQTAGKVDRLKNEVIELERQLGAHKKALELIAATLGIDVDLTPVPTEREKHDAEEASYDHPTMPTIKEVIASADRSIEKARERFGRQNTTSS